MYDEESAHTTQSEAQRALDMVESSICCCCHVKVFTVLLFLISITSFVAKYALYSYDIEISGIFTLTGLDATFYQGTGVLIFFIFQAFVLFCFFLSLACNSYRLVYPFILYQMLLFVSQFSVMLFYVYLIVKDAGLGPYHDAAIESVKHLRFDVVQELFQNVVSAGDYYIGLAVACGMSILLTINTLILSIIQNYCAYLKLRADYYRML